MKWATFASTKAAKHKKRRVPMFLARGAFKLLHIELYPPRNLHFSRHGGCRGLCREAHTIITQQARQVKGSVGRHDPRDNPSRGITMDSVSRDPRDTLSNVDPEAIQFSARFSEVLETRVAPSPRCKLRYCRRRATSAYHSKPSTRADWDALKHICESQRQTYEESLAAVVALGGRAKDFNQSSDDI